MPSQQSTRLDYLDAVRSFALILGVFFHASLSFMPIFIGWAVMDISTSNVAAFFALVSHSFRLELFFLIAGFFAHMNFHQKGINAFIKSRLSRIAIPFIIGWFLLRPLLISGWIMGAESMQGDVNIWPALASGFTSLLTIESIGKDFLVGTHLWFLYYLLLISVSIIVLRYLIAVNQSVKSNIEQLADRAVRWLCNSRLAILIIAIPTACCLWFMDHWGVDTPDKSLIPNIPVLLIYGGFFLFGWLLHRQSALLEQFANLTWGKVLLCIAAIIATVVLSKFEMNLAHSQYKLFKACYLLSYAIMMWSMLALTIGVCKHLFKRSNKTIRYIADSSYWLYLIHLPIVIFLQTAFAELPFHWGIKLISICALTIILSIILYDAFIRSTFIGAILNGKKRARVFFKSSR
ncbi:MAG: acyltransferase family protein [Colwellia sp.]|nr:acyltransferase family protein [Colwellia sp.]